MTTERIHVVADLGRAASGHAMPFLVTTVTTRKRVGEARTVKLAEALAQAIRTQDAPGAELAAQAGVKWHKAAAVPAPRRPIPGEWQAYCFVCDRCLFDHDGAPVTVARHRDRQGVCLECAAVAGVTIWEHTPVGRTRA